MARSPKEAIVIIIDVGSSIVSDGIDVKPDFLLRAIQCVSMIIKRKIFSESKDEIALVLLGTEHTENNLDYDHIVVPFSLTLASWELLQYVENDLKESKIRADWLDAVVVGMDLLKEHSQAKLFAEKKIVLFTDLKSNVTDDKVDIIIECMKKEDYNLIVIGPDTNINIKAEDDVDMDDTNITNGTDKLKSKIELAGSHLLNKILNEVGGVICNFDEAVPQLMYFQKKNIRSQPWNIVMDIGPEIKIPVVGYKKISRAKLPTWKQTSSSEKGIRVESERIYTRQDENQTSVDPEDVISGYSYGNTLVPMSDIDKISMSYKSGPKCLSILGFTKSSNVPRYLLIGEGCMHFTAQKNDSNAASALSSLINAMKDLDMYAISRKVYRDNTATRLGVLFPKIASYECLVFAELPYSEDMRQFVFPPILTDKNKPSQEQLDAIDSLIDNMDLTAVKNEFGEQTEVLKPKSTFNPYLQHAYHSLAHRALNPDAPLPPVKEEILKLLRSVFEDKPGYKLAIKQVEKCNKTFSLYSDVDAVNDKPIQEATDLKKVTMESLMESKIVEVGSVKPVEDFKFLIEQSQPFVEVCSQMQKVITNVVFEKDPSIYNDWIPKFRENLVERGRMPFWKRIVDGKLGLISSDESEISCVNEADATSFLEYNEPMQEEEAAPVEDDMDEDDL
ncbi:hypothetical protein L9F63_016259, partial [Diploptera punctata]